MRALARAFLDTKKDGFGWEGWGRESRGTARGGEESRGGGLGATGDFIRVPIPRRRSAALSLQPTKSLHAEGSLPGRKALGTAGTRDMVLEIRVSDPETHTISKVQAMSTCVLGFGHRHHSAQAAFFFFLFCRS